MPAPKHINMEKQQQKEQGKKTTKKDCLSIQHLLNTDVDSLPASCGLKILELSKSDLITSSLV